MHFLNHPATFELPNCDLEQHFVLLVHGIPPSAWKKEKKNPQINMSDFTHVFEKKWSNQRDHFGIMWGLRFTQRHHWKFKSFGMSNCSKWEIVIDILEVCAASFFMVWKSSKCSWNTQGAHFSEMVAIPPWTCDVPGGLNLPVTKTLWCYMKGISSTQWNCGFNLKKSKLLNLTEQNKELIPFK